MKRFLAVFSLSVFFCAWTSAQYPEDALRYSFPGLGVGARSLGMGTAYTGVADDFSATYWNPAGLAQAKVSEFSLGFSQLSNNDESNFFNSGKSFSNSATNINNVGLVYPFPTTRGSLVFSLGYGRQADFTSGLSFEGFNKNSSIIQYWAPDSGLLDQIPGGNLAYELYLANVDSLSPTQYRWDSKIMNNLTQSGKVIEGGGLNNVSAALASEVARNVYIGLTLNFITGSYSYTRNYYEDDFNNFHTVRPFDLSSLSLLETVETDLSGFSAKLGLLYKFGPNSRLGITVKTPSWISVRETFSQEGTSLFDDGFTVSYATATGEHNEYDITTPFVFDAAVSHQVRDLLLSAEAEFTDYTQMEFRNANQDLLALNTDIKSIFQPTVNLKAGAEYTFPDAGFRLRAGFAYLPSPYSGDPSSFARKFITAGLGFTVEQSVIVDLGYAHGSWDTYRINYDATSSPQEKVTTHNVIGTVSYRF